jgi:hypothetical protein
MAAQTVGGHHQMKMNRHRQIFRRNAIDLSTGF